jgi:hypothetical protein
MKQDVRGNIAYQAPNILAEKSETKNLQWDSAISPLVGVALGHQSVWITWVAWIRWLQRVSAPQ